MDGEEGIEASGPSRSRRMLRLPMTAMADGPSGRLLAARPFGLEVPPKFEHPCAPTQKLRSGFPSMAEFQGVVSIALRRAPRHGPK